MPRLDGLGVLRALRNPGEGPAAPPCLVLTTFDDRALALAAIREGARGYLRKDVSLPELIAAVETLAAGGTYLQPALTRALQAGAAEGPLASHPATAPAEPLTPRETEVLRLMAAAYTNREIAAALGTAEGTVKIQVSSVLAKLAARDRTHAVLLALERRILEEKPAQQPETAGTAGTADQGRQGLRFLSSLESLRSLESLVPPATPRPTPTYRYSRRGPRQRSSPGGSNLTKDRATGRDIVLAIGENMRQSLEPLVTKTIAPSLYQVYLHGDDHDRLRTLFGELEAEAQDPPRRRARRGSTAARPRRSPAS